MIRMASDPVLGTIHVPGFPLHYSAVKVGFDSVAPLLGEHNEEVLSELAGGGAAFAKLVASGVIHDNSREMRRFREQSG